MSSFIFYFSYTLLSTYSLPLVAPSYSSTLLFFSFSHVSSFSLLLHLPSRSSPSLLLVSNIIFGSLLTLSSFTRFSLCCLHPASLILLPILTLLPLHLFYYLPASYTLTPSPFSHATWSYTFILLFGIASICISYPLSSSRFTSVDRDSREWEPLPTEGMNENRLVEAIIGRPRVQEARGGESHRSGG